MIKYVVGDATLPQAAGNRIVAHVCNDRGRWGKGFVLALSKRWEEPERSYRSWHDGRARNDFALGSIRIVPVEPFIWVANMIAQEGLGSRHGGPLVRYDAVRSCLEKLAPEAISLGASVHMPRIGCGLGGGQWELIEPIISETLVAQGIKVTIYDYD